MWCVPRVTVGYVAKMEGVLATLEKPLDPLEPVVALDEKPVLLRDDARPGLPMTTTEPVARRDYEYVRKGSANLFVAVEPLTGHYLVEATPNRKGPAFARMLAKVAASYEGATTIHLIVDNLSTHSRRCVVNALGPERGAALWARFTLHFTPEHGSWLNPAELGISRVVREALGRRRVGSLRELKRIVRAWRQQANRRPRAIEWRFTRNKARKSFGYEGLLKRRSQH